MKKHAQAVREVKMARKKLTEAPNTKNTAKNSGKSNKPIKDSAELAVERARAGHLDGELRAFNPNYLHSGMPDFNPFEENESTEESARSSVPIGHLKEETKGRQPRSRMASTRDAGARDKQDIINHYIREVERTNEGPLDIAPELVPEGYTTLWARATVRDHPDPTNLRNLERKGWRYATADEMPQLAFFDHKHGIRDDAEHIYNGGLVLMLRYEEITKHELQYFKKLEKERTSQMANKMRTVDGDLHPFAVNSRNQFADPFLNHSPVGQDFRTQFVDRY